MKRGMYFICGVALIASLLLAASHSDAQYADPNFTPQTGQGGKDVVWVPTPQELVNTMLIMAKVTPADYVVDLGSGDGRLVISAAKLGATALGIEYNQDMVALARRTAAEEGVSAKATFERADIFEYDFSKATVVTLFLLEDLNLRLRPTILDMKPGTRVVSNSFTMDNWIPDQTANILDLGDWTIAHLWIVPAKVGGTWKLDDGQLTLTQKFQYITGTLTKGKETFKLTGKLNGDKISFDAGGSKFTGTVSGNTMSGSRAGGDDWKATR